MKLERIITLIYSKSSTILSLKAMEAALGSSKDYSLKQYLLLAEKLQTKAKVSDIFFPVLYDPILRRRERTKVH